MKILLNLAAVATTDVKTELTNVCSSDEASIKAAAQKIAKGTPALPTTGPQAVKASPAVSPEPLLPINVEYNIFFVFPLASSNIY